MSDCLNDLKYIICSFEFRKDDEKHRFNFEPSDYACDIIINENLFEGIFGYMSKTLNVPMIDKPKQTGLSVDLLIKCLESYNLPIAYTFCLGFESQEQPRWTIEKFVESIESKGFDEKSIDMHEMCDDSLSLAKETY